MCTPFQMNVLGRNRKKKGAAGDEEAGDGKGYFQDGRSDVACLKHLGSIQQRGRN